MLLSIICTTAIPSFEKGLLQGCSFEAHFPHAHALRILFPAALEGVAERGNITSFIKKKIKQNQQRKAPKTPVT